MLGKFLENIHVEYLVLDEAFRILEMSSGVGQYAEEGEENLTAQTDVRIGFPELVGLEEKIKTIARGESNGFELKGICRRSDYQNPLYLDLYISSYQMVKDFWLYDDDNEEITNEQPISIVLLKDATERMVLEQQLGQIVKETMLLANALDDYQKYLSNILNYMSDALVVCDRFGTIKMVNRSLRNLFGYPESELIHQSINKILPNLNFHPQNYTRYSQTTELFQNVAVTCQTKNGQSISLSLSASVICYEQPEPPHYIYLARQNTLDNYQQYLSSILTYMSDALVVCDRHDTIKMVNSSLKKIFGYSEAELIQQPISKILPDSRLHPQNYTGYLRTTELFQNVAVTCETKNGKSISLSISASVIYYNQREFPNYPNYIYLARTISSSQTENQKNTTTPSLPPSVQNQELNDLKSRFLQTLSTEFRHSMRQLLSLTENLDNPEIQENPDTRNQTIQHIQETVQATNALLEDIIATNNLQLGRWKLSPKAISLGSFCKKIINIVQNEYHSSHCITLVIQGTPQTVCLDPELLHYIVYHLLSNAVKYSPNPEPLICLQVIYQNNQTVMLQVRDSGMGIDDGDRDRIFDSFYRGSNVENIPGTGLGLTIVKQAVELHGGTVSFDSNSDGGTTFTVILPSSQ